MRTFRLDLVTLVLSTSKLVLSPQTETSRACWAEFRAFARAGFCAALLGANAFSVAIPRLSQLIRETMTHNPASLVKFQPRVLVSHLMSGLETHGCSISAPVARGSHLRLNTCPRLELRHDVLTGVKGREQRIFHITAHSNMSECYVSRRLNWLFNTNNEPSM